MVAEAVTAGLSGKMPLQKALASYERTRNKQTRPMYDLSVDLASFRAPSADDRTLFQAIAETPGAPDQFLGVISDSVPIRRFFSPPNLIKLVGVRGMLRLARGRQRVTASATSA